MHQLAEAPTSSDVQRRTTEFVARVQPAARGEQLLHDVPLTLIDGSMQRCESAFVHHICTCPCREQGRRDLRPAVHTGQVQRSLSQLHMHIRERTVSTVTKIEIRAETC
jgi:hypothetical protein